MATFSQSPPARVNPSMNYDAECLGKLKVARVFSENKHQITSLQFDSTGDFCLTACKQDATICLYDCKQGTLKKKLFSKTFGIETCIFTHYHTAILHTATKDNVIRYLSLHDNAYLKEFNGHSDLVTCLLMSPINDTFMSASMDGTVRIWDLHEGICKGIIDCKTNKFPPLIAIDPEGFIFALASENRSLRLYDMKNAQKGPFACFEIVDKDQSGLQWTQIKFSPDGKLLMIGTDGDSIYLIDSFDGMVKGCLSGHQNNSKTKFHADFSPNSKWIACGSEDLDICIWNVESKQLVHRLPGHTLVPVWIKFNPIYLLMASTCTNLVIFIFHNPNLYL